MSYANPSAALKSRKFVREGINLKLANSRPIIPCSEVSYVILTTIAITMYPNNNNRLILVGDR